MRETPATHPSVYDEHFYAFHRDYSLDSARAVVPLVVDLLRPKSAVDVGCGLGSWLAVLREYGVERLVGIDGEHVDRAKLLIRPDEFVAADLSEPFRLSQQFDLAVCLEVGEHLPSSSAAVLVDSLVALAPVVLFSAAPPGQGGIGHLNEQWPAYWQAQFARHGYLWLDCVRPLIWGSSSVAWWYRQNTFLAIRHSELLARPDWKRLAELHDPGWLLLRDHVLKANVRDDVLNVNVAPTSVRWLARQLVNELLRRARRWQEYTR